MSILFPPTYPATVLIAIKEFVEKMNTQTQKRHKDRILNRKKKVYVLDKDRFLDNRKIAVKVRTDVKSIRL